LVLVLAGGIGAIAYASLSNNSSTNRQLKRKLKKRKETRMSAPLHVLAEVMQQCKSRSRS